MPSVEAAAEPCVVIERCDISFVLIGERLREWREARKWSKRDLQQASGISRFQTARIENGHDVPDVEMLKRYACALEIPVSTLLNDCDSPQMDNEELHGLAAFAKVFSSLKAGERNLLRSIALRMRRKDVQAVVYSAPML